MTLQQEAYTRIDQMTDDGIRVLINLIDTMRTVSVTGFKDSDVDIPLTGVDSEMTREEKKRRFMQSAGKIQVDAEAVRELRERSMI